eukprot:g5311.t1
MFSNFLDQSKTIFSSATAKMKEKIPTLDSLQHQFEERIGISSSDVNLTFDRGNPKAPPSLKHFVYVTPQVVAMAFPSARPHKGQNNIFEVAKHLNKHHPDHYMVWNLSEMAYHPGPEVFANQVIEYRFPGHPAPPLNLMFKICTSIENWISADEENIAVVHCATGRGRTATVIGCYLAWKGFVSSPLEGLQFVAKKKKMSLNMLALPSQTRYISYFSKILEGAKPNCETLILRRIIINSIPDFGLKNGGFRPYVQLFQMGKLLWSSMPEEGSNKNSMREENLPKSYYPEEGGSVTFDVNCALEGDILMRCRHLGLPGEVPGSSLGKRISVFRAGFHIGYIRSNSIHFSKQQLDGANENEKVSSDFSVTLIFGKVIVGNAADSKEGEGESLVISQGESEAYTEEVVRNAAFWGQVNRRQQHKKEQIREDKAGINVNQQQKNSINKEAPLQSPVRERAQERLRKREELRKRVAAKKESKRVENIEKRRRRQLLQEIGTPEKKKKVEEEEKERDRSENENVALEMRELEAELGLQTPSPENSTKEPLLSRLPSGDDALKELNNGLEALGIDGISMDDFQSNDSNTEEQLDLSILDGIDDLLKE